MSANYNPLVSVIIPTYNNSVLLQEAIDSVLAQNYSPIEILVVDDGSTDDTRDVCARYGEKIRYIYQQNAGTSIARNTALRNATGELIAFLDHDDRWLPGKLARQTLCFADNARVGLVHSALRRFHHKDNRTIAEYFPGHDVNFHDLLGHTVLNIQTVIISKRVLDDIGLLDETLKGTDDWDFCLRIAAKYTIVGLPEIMAEAREHGENQSAKIDRMFTNAMRVLDKHSHYHIDCGDCSKAIASARRLLREDYFENARSQSRHAIQQRNYVLGISLRLKSIWINPSSLNRLPRVMLGRLLAR